MANSLTFRESWKSNHHQLCLLLNHNLQSKSQLSTRFWKHPFGTLFMDKENASGVLRTEVHRHSKGPGSSYFRIPLGADSSMDRMHDRDKVGDKPKLEPEEMHHDIVAMIRMWMALSQSFNVLITTPFLLWRSCYPRRRKKLIFVAT